MSEVCCQSKLLCAIPSYIRLVQNGSKKRGGTAQVLQMKMNLGKFKPRAWRRGFTELQQSVPSWGSSGLHNNHSKQSTCHPKFRKQFVSNPNKCEHVAFAKLLFSYLKLTEHFSRQRALEPHWTAWSLCLFEIPHHSLIIY